MNLLELSIYFAGGLLSLVAIANVFAPKMLDYAGNVKRMDRIVEQIFKVHCFYTALTLVGMAAACFMYAGELVAGEAWLFSLFMAVFWGIRVCLQMGYYDAKTKRDRPLFNVMFLAAFTWVAGVFCVLCFL